MSSLNSLYVLVTVSITCLMSSLTDTSDNWKPELLTTKEKEEEAGEEKEEEKEAEEEE